jgi:DNA-binding beta-propeller fold protein YncE
MKRSGKTSGSSVFSILPLLGAALVLAAQARAAEAPFTVRMQPLPGASQAGIYMDYIAFDPATRLVWVPAGNTGTVAVVDPATGTVRTIDGLPTAEMGTGDRKRKVGPSSVSAGAGVVYIGNRADSTVCAFNARSLARVACHRLDSMPDAVVHVAGTKEVWVTTPRDKSIRILDAATLDEKARLAFDGNPEGFAVDGKRNRFYTNLEDKDRSLAIDLATHKTVATWNPSCGPDGPHGLRVDAAAGHLFVACSTRVEVLDAAHDGAVLSSIDTGDGVDDIDYQPATHLLYVGAAKAGQLTIARDGEQGKLSVVAKVPTHVGARNPAVTDKGVVYLAHSALGGLSDLVVVEPRK